MIDMYQALQSMQSKAEGAASYALHRFLGAESHGTESACIFNVTSRLLAAEVGGDSSDPNVHSPHKCE